MAYEKRRGRNYLYGKERRDGRVKSVYRGRSQVSDELARLEKERLSRERLLRKACRKRRQLAEEKRALLLADLDLLRRAVALIERAALLAAGFKQHRGQWRSVVRGRPRLGAPSRKGVEVFVMIESMQHDSRRDRSLEPEDRRALEEAVADLEQIMEGTDPERPTAADRERLSKAISDRAIQWTGLDRLTISIRKAILDRVPDLSPAERADFIQMFNEEMLELGYKGACRAEQVRIQLVVVNRLDLAVTWLEREHALRREPHAARASTHEPKLTSAHERYRVSLEALDRFRRQSGHGRR